MVLGTADVDSTTKEEVMDGTEKSTKKAEAPEAPAKSKGGKKAVKAATKETKPRREKIPAEDVCVFAFRLSTKDRDRLHEAAGSGKASGFVLAAALAAASGEVEQFKAVVASRATK
jgi:hypothetical protein